jgi:uncharacterized membrane protein
VPTDAEQRSHASSERLKFFSDAVVAIAITLLALDLPLPHGADAHTFWHSVRAEDGHYLAFLISFFVIASAWVQHRRLFDAIDKIDTVIERLNFLWLFTIVLTPFATRLLTSPGSSTKDVHAVLFGFYSLVETLSSIAMLGIVRRTVRRSLNDPDVPTTVFKSAWWGNVRVVAGFGLSIPFFFVFRSAWVLWFAGPLALRVARELVMRLRDHGAEPPS